MPRTAKGTKKVKANRLVKVYVKNRCNAAAVAREFGISSQAVGKQLKKKEAKNILQAMVEDERFQGMLNQTALDGLQAKIKVGKKMYPDHRARHKYWHDLVTAAGLISKDGINIHIGNKTQNNKIMIIRSAKEADKIKTEDAEVVDA